MICINSFRGHDGWVVKTICFKGSNVIINQSASNCLGSKLKIPTLQILVNLCQLACKRVSSFHWALWFSSLSLNWRPQYKCKNLDWGFNTISLLHSTKLGTVTFHPTVQVIAESQMHVCMNGQRSAKIFLIKINIYLLINKNLAN